MSALGRRLPDLAPARAADVIATRGCALGRPLVILDETSSTNDDAKEGAREGAPHGAVWIAESQTRGRGRLGRSWVSPRGENLLFSVLLRPKCPPRNVPPLALVVGLAVRDAVARALGLALEGARENTPRVKWPNDVLVGKKKIAGVLVESQIAGDRVEYVVAGIGLNVHTRELPAEVRETATSLALAGGRDLDRAEILADVLAALDRDVDLVAHKGLGMVHARLSEHDALRGVAIAIDGIDGTRGLGAGIDLDGRLRVRRDDGVIVAIASGEAIVG